MKKKTIPAKKLHAYIRAAIQVVFFICFPSAFTTAFSAIKSIFTQIAWHSVPLQLYLDGFSVVMPVHLVHWAMPFEVFMFSSAKNARRSQLLGNRKNCHYIS